jgi:hypothetical protein
MKSESLQVQVGVFVIAAEPTLSIGKKAQLFFF